VRKTGWRGVVINLRYKSIGKWSDGAKSRTVRSVTRVESEGTITRSSVLYMLNSCKGIVKDTAS